MTKKLTQRTMPNGEIKITDDRGYVEATYASDSDPEYLAFVASIATTPGASLYDVNRLSFVAVSEIDTRA